MAFLEAKGIKKRFGGVIALKNGNLSCEAGRITGLIGSNGSGKSTISKIITGVYKADDGEVYLDGKLCKFKTPNEANAAGIAMAFQNLSLVEDLSVWQNIYLGIENSKGIFVDNETAIKGAAEIMDKLIPGFDVKRKIYQLNAGELQLVEIAKAMATNPRLLILDEPTAALEQAEVDALFKLLRELAAQKIAIIFTSHRLGEIIDICDDIVVFRNGEDVGYIDFEKDGRDTDPIIALLTGETGEFKTGKVYREIKDHPVLKIEHLTDNTKLKDISFTLNKGEVLGIAGLAGQGQEQLMLALAGFYKDIKVESAVVMDKPVKMSNPRQMVRSGVFLVPGDRQKEGVFLKDSIYTNIIFAKQGLKKQPFFTPTKAYKKECEDIISKLSIVCENIETPVGSLSGGNQQKVVVGKWLPFNINVLLLSDPAKGVDIGAKRDMYEFIMKMVEEKEMSVILYASDYNELIDYCDRLLVMYEGNVIEELTGADITEENIIHASMNVGEVS